MEVFALLGEFDLHGSLLLGVYSSEEEARTAYGVYTRYGDRCIDAYYIERRVVGAVVDADAYRTYIG
jgi:hypothetical protein